MACAYKESNLHFTRDFGYAFPHAIEESITFTLG